MALKTLEGVKEINGFKVVVMDELREQFPEKFNESGAMDYKWFEKDIRPHNFIYVRNDVNSVSFTMQNGPIKECFANGFDACHEIMLKEVEETPLIGICLNCDAKFELSNAAALDIIRERDQLKNALADATIREVNLRDDWLDARAKLGKAIGALEGIQCCPDNFNRERLAKLIKELEGK